MKLRLFKKSNWALSYLNSVLRHGSPYTPNFLSLAPFLLCTSAPRRKKFFLPFSIEGEDWTFKGGETNVFFFRNQRFQMVKAVNKQIHSRSSLHFSDKDFRGKIDILIQPHYWPNKNIRSFTLREVHKPCIITRSKLSG